MALLLQRLQMSRAGRNPTSASDSASAEAESVTSPDLVRSSRDGDQFHYYWAARQCLKLLRSAAAGLPGCRSRDPRRWMQQPQASR